MNFRIASVSDVGLVRSDNQDYILVQREGRMSLLVVCDGMGGHAGGQIASQLAAETFVQHVDCAGPVDEAAMARAVEAAQVAVRGRIMSEPDLLGMGTTLVAAWLCDSDVLIVNIGDSRAYLQRGENLERITEDHSVVFEMMHRGEITEEQAERHPQRNVITRAIDGTTRITPDFVRRRLDPGDRLLLCSDGLNSMVDRHGIASILGMGEDPEVICDDLVSAALREGGHDNVSVVVAIAVEGAAAADIGEDTPTGEGVPTTPVARWWSGIGGWGPMTLVLSLIAVIVALVWIIWIEPGARAPFQGGSIDTVADDTVSVDTATGRSSAGDTSATGSRPAWEQ